jgi:hypothetical protein
LAGFPLAGLAAALIDSSEGTDTPGSELYDVMAAHGDAVFVSALVFMLSALLTVPAACAGLRLARDRGGLAAMAAAALMTLGALAHMGYATWQVTISQVARDSDREALVGFLDRQQDTTTAVLLPLLFCIAFGVLFQAIALRRAGVVPAWFLWSVVALLCFDLVMNSVSIADSRLPVVGVWALLSVLYGYLAVSVAARRLLEASDEPDAAGRVASTPSSIGVDRSLLST